MSTAVSDPTTSVQVLLDAAGLTISAAEFDKLVAIYPGMRASVDALYDVAMGKEEEPQLIFTPLV
ncbi:hypothetical protein [Kineococcus sp. SYSU DK003]|uniref:hypothetical protein n=1 Tax=Kineococcus sp. SYSU DK003 TaxID=3383124 RepID=UPI003D7D0167